MKMVESKNNMIEECPHRNPIEDSGSLICPECGLVLERVFEDTSTVITPPNPFEHWKNANSKQWSEKIDPLNNFTFIGYGKYNPRDCFHKKLEPNTRKLFFRLIKLQLQVNNNDNRYQEKKTLKILKRVVQTLNIPHRLYERAKNIYLSLHKDHKEDIKYRNPTVVAYCLYYAIKEDQYPLDLNSLIHRFHVIGHGFVVRTSMFKIYKEFPEYFPTLQPRNAETYLGAAISSILRLKPALKSSGLSLETYSRNLLKQIRFRTGKPKCLLAAVIYRAGKQLRLGLTQQLIAEVCGITEVSLRNHFRKLFGGK